MRIVGDENNENKNFKKCIPIIALTLSLIANAVLLTLSLLPPKQSRIHGTYEYGASVTGVMSSNYAISFCETLTPAGTIDDYHGTYWCLKPTCEDHLEDGSYSLREDGVIVLTSTEGKISYALKEGDRHLYLFRPEPAPYAAIFSKALDAAYGYPAEEP